VILSGTMDDGAAGLAAIKACGGAAVVQDPGDALCAGMPEAALEVVNADHVVRAAGMGRVLDELAREPVSALASAGAASTNQLMHSSRSQVASISSASLTADPGELPAEGVDMSCPDCGGALQRVATGPLERYRCRVGHVYSPESLLERKSTELEAALWAALRSLEETADASRRLAQRARCKGSAGAARRFGERQTDAARRADVIRQALNGFDASINETTDEALAK
jgi:two-component system chemotaxis response regulator CheB